MVILMNFIFIKKGNKKIDNIEIEIRKYKKYLGLKK